MSPSSRPKEILKTIDEDDIDELKEDELVAGLEV